MIQEAGLDGFWLHRRLEAEGIDSYVVDPASIAVSRHARRVKTDRIDGEMLLRTLLAYMRGDPRVCAMVRAPTPQDEDRRRVSREPKATFVVTTALGRGVSCTKSRMPTRAPWSVGWISPCFSPG